MALERSPMAKVVITHPVVDIERWLEGKQERADAFAPFGTDVRDFVAADGSNQIALTADITDMEGVQAMIASPPPEVVALMEKHGVLQPLLTFIER
jgi:hypothetical protein